MDQAVGASAFPVQRAHADPEQEPAAHAEVAGAGCPPSARLTSLKRLSEGTAEAAAGVGEDLQRSQAAGEPLLLAAGEPLLPPESQCGGSPLSQLRARAETNGQ